MDFSDQRGTLRTVLGIRQPTGAALKAVGDGGAEGGTYVSDDAGRDGGPGGDGGLRVTPYRSQRCHGVRAKQTGEIDRELWAIHLDVVRQAQAIARR
jgi:hypothetical protein